MTLPGAVEGLKFIFIPSSAAFNMSAVSAALGQVFYSLSLCMGITITYGSYLRDKENIPKAAQRGGTGHHHCIDGRNRHLSRPCFPSGWSRTGPGLIFGTLPKVFSSIKEGRSSPLFFALVLFAAVTSAIALLEVTVSFAVDSPEWTRKKATVILGSLIFLKGFPAPCPSAPWGM